VLLHGLRRRGDRLVLLLALVQLQARRRLDGSTFAAADIHAQRAPVAAADTIAVAAPDPKTFAGPDAGAWRSYGSTSLRANA
jgi:hypothetical protein